MSMTALPMAVVDHVKNRFEKVLQKRIGKIAFGWILMDQAGSLSSSKAVNRHRTTCKGLDSGCCSFSSSCGTETTYLLAVDWLIHYKVNQPPGSVGPSILRRDSASGCPSSDTKRHWVVGCDGVLGDHLLSHWLLIVILCL